MARASSFERQMLNLINEERANAGLQPLRLNVLLNDSSEDHTEWMLRSGNFSHVGEGGSSATERTTDSGYPLEGSWRTGENIAWQSERGSQGIEDDVRQLHESLMNSPGHRANILNPDFTEIGIGIVRGDFRGYDSVAVTQNFAATDADTSRFADLVETASPDPAPAPQPDPEPQPEPAPAPSPAPEPAPEPDQPHIVTGFANGTEGDDTLVTSGSWSVVFAGAGDDTVTGSHGFDFLHGGAGDDRLSGGGGRDVLIGGAGDDIMTGGAGRDQFIFAGGSDVISDFSPGEDIVFFHPDLRTGPDTGRSWQDNILIEDGNTVIDLGAGNTLTLNGITDVSTADMFNLFC
ncbi:CAP domain-containing protein [Roseibium sp.]|uniref:CAP domain-containing protein n=1 Tax=Roseibium sp. TaxID=1936156 RepID=UPI003BAEDE07